MHPTSTPRRTPPAAVRRQLRKEVAFGCPIPDCRLPYLEYHHFDPPWHEDPHHNRDGMVPLCPGHHAQADAGTWTPAQLRQFKVEADAADPARGRFNWMRSQLLGVVGGVFYFENEYLITAGGEPVLWFQRGENGELLVNLRMSLGRDPSTRLQIDQNDFVLAGDAVDVECPPSGKSLKIRYAEGDRIELAFVELANADAAYHRYGDKGVPPQFCEVSWPLTAVEVVIEVTNTGISFGPQATSIGSSVVMGGWLVRNGVGMALPFVPPQSPWPRTGVAGPE
jgi:hypothetical protein